MIRWYNNTYEHSESILREHGKIMKIIHAGIGCSRLASHDMTEAMNKCVYYLDIRVTCLVKHKN
jgi:hypothetical protein